MKMGNFVELYRINAYPDEDIERMESAGIRVETEDMNDGWVTIVKVHKDHLDKARRISRLA
jgi:hypothetical protein